MVRSGVQGALYLSRFPTARPFGSFNPMPRVAWRLFVIFLCIPRFPRRTGSRPTCCPLYFDVELALQDDVSILIYPFSRGTG